MPAEIDKQHPEYAAFVDRWHRCLDAYNGQDDIKEATTQYLPKLDGQDTTQYEAYLQRARWFNATALTVKGYTGLVSRKDPIIEAKGAAESFVESVNRNDIGIEDYLMNALKQLILTGRCGTLVDYTINSEEATMMDGGRVVWAFYEAPTILRWRFSDGKLVQLVLLELAYDDDYEVTETYRILEIQDGFYVQELYDNEGILIDTIVPRMNGSRLDFIPFVFHTNATSGDTVINPPIMDLVDLNIAHYQLQADHRHALHYIASPTPYVTGVSASDEERPVTVGPSKIWYLPDTESKVGMLEFTGQGLAAIKKELETMEEQLGQLGARILQPNTEKTATAARLSSMAETSVLSELVTTINNDATTILDITDRWLGSSDTLIELNKDFWPRDIEPQMIQALVSAWQQGAFSYEDLFRKLQQGEIIDGAKSFEDHEEEMLNEGMDLDRAGPESTIAPNEEEEELMDEDEAEGQGDSNLA
jgi:hypothetical protein